MSPYLTLFLTIPLTALLTYVLGQDHRSTAARLFAAYIGTALLLTCMALVRLTTTSPQVASDLSNMIGPLLAANNQ
jgi:hypothetical protein